MRQNRNKIRNKRQDADQRRKAVRELVFVIVAAALLTLLFLMVNVTRQQIMQRRGAQIQKERQEENYREIEEQYRQQVQKVLAQAGYPNSGVTMTYVTSGDGDREYTVQIHHRRLENMKTEERKQLEQEVSHVKIGAGSCSLSLT